MRCNPATSLALRSTRAAAGRFGILDPLSRGCKHRFSRGDLSSVVTLKVHDLWRLRQRVQEAGASPAAALRLWAASQATRDRRHSSQLENWVRRVTRPPGMIRSTRASTGGCEIRIRRDACCEVSISGSRIHVGMRQQRENGTGLKI